MIQRTSMLSLLLSVPIWLVKYTLPLVTASSDPQSNDIWMVLIMKVPKNDGAFPLIAFNSI